MRDKIYYTIKPYMPRRLRLALRRVLTSRKVKACRGIWPIHEAASRPPKDWKGWPEAGRFPFVITHDVEGTEGINRIKRLAELEMSYGFRSSYNLVPEGEYEVTQELITWLRERGFEVGVHDLRHDGRLHESKESFARSAVKINGYLKQWGVTGFRSGFMRHHLDWFHDLDIEYDASTFDTDPMEPQPDAAGTIFPFWVPTPDKRGGRDGYAELPYTLPQDSTLFLLLQEKTSRIWIDKLDWVASHGGMALVNIHPDYLRFEDEPATEGTFPVARYIELLQHVRDKYAERAWNALPIQIARHVSAMQPVFEPRQAKRILLVTYSFYERDARVSRYGRTLAERGDEVDVISLRSSSSIPEVEMISGCRVHRIQDRKIDETTPMSFLGKLTKFLARAAWWIAKQHTNRRYDVIHVHNIPDFLVFSTLAAKLTGTKVILDIHDMVPELYQSKFHVGSRSLSFRALCLMEKASAMFADHVIMANDLWRVPYTARSAPPAKVSVLINFVDNKLFGLRTRKRSDQRKIIIFPGTLQVHQGLDLAIRAMPAILRREPHAELHIYGEGTAKRDLIELSREMGLETQVKFFPYVPVTQLADVLAEADVGIVPKRADCFGNGALATKILEFMSVGIPVVASTTDIERKYFNENVLRFFESGNHEALGENILALLEDAELTKRMVKNAHAFAFEHSWERHKGEYLALVDRLTAPQTERRQVTLDESCVSIESSL